MAQAAQADLKATHYTQQLQSCLTRGAWADSAPAKAAKGPPMSWQELVRKFKKHCPTRHITAELALHTQSLSILLLPPRVDIKRITPEDLDGDSEEPAGSLILGKECELDPSRVEDARLGFAALELLNDTPEERDSTLFTRAYFAYALKRYKECLALLNSMNFDENPSPTATTSRTGTVSSRLSVPNHPASTHGSSSSTSTGTHLTWTGSIASVDVDERDSKMWRIVEIVRGRCLQGMAMEKLKHEQEAFVAYEAALPLLQNLRIVQSSSAQPVTHPHPSFIKYRELWRWTERLLWRASCLASKHAHIQRAMDIYRVYASHAQYFPPSFRPNHRGTVTALHLQGLLLTSPGSPMASRNQTRLAWITEARTLLGEYRLVLAACTVFPRAGERNVRVEEYCDALMAVWERSGAKGQEASWVIEILWWATRMTFHSHRIFRHLFRLLHASGEHMLAKRTLKLYVQLVTKARQASMSEIETTIRRRRTLDSLDNDPAVMGEGEPVEEPSGSDNDRQFVGGLIFGARMLCRLPGDVEDIKWAKECLDIAKGVLAGNARLARDLTLKARLSCADGIVESTLAYRDADRATRPLLMRSAVDHLASAVQFNSESADAYYHLAVALLQAGSTRDLDASIKAARHAVELESTEIRYWHLLGLALSASGENNQARKVLEIGEALETDEETEAQIEDSSATPAGDSIVGTPRSDSPTANDSLLSASATSVPSPTTMLLPVPDHPRPSREDLFEHGLQLRMTLLALIERMQGAESASGRWVEVFAWFAERGGWAQPTEDRRASFELPPINTIPPSDSGHDTEESGASLPVPLLTITKSMSATHLPSSGLPVTIIPPTPSENGDAESIHTIRLSNEDEQGAPRKKKAHQIIKEQVNKRQSQIQTFSKKLGRSSTLRSQMSRASSTPDISLMLGDNSRLYQASSIHSRQRMSPRNSYMSFTPRSMAPTPPPAPLAAIVEKRTEREKRLIADLWLTSAATFRRMGKLDEARAAIQEAETLDEGNPRVWVQLGLYFVGNGEITRAITAFHKALVIDPDHIPAVVHLAQQYLNPAIGPTTAIASEASESRKGAVDLAAGMLSSFTKGPGWDVPEAWYLLAKAVSLQGRPERERECLTYALGLVEGKPIRDIRVALDCAL